MAEMGEGITSPEDQEFETGKTGGESEEAERKETEPEQKLEARFPDGSPVKIYPEGTGTEEPVKLEFLKENCVTLPGEIPIVFEGSLLHLVKPKESETAKGSTGFEKFFRIKKLDEQEGTVSIAEESFPPE